jgi:hypothetical protein
MDSQQHFVRGLILFTLLGMVFFSLEFWGEWERLGRPGMAELSWAGTNNAKLVDILSPMARAYNNILAMLLATIGLAIPLTASMHTPKLIDMFLRDRINQWMLSFFALGAGHVLWVEYIIGPQFAPVWAFRLAVGGAILGWLALTPYFFYVIRFLDPSNILGRIKLQLTQEIEAVQACRMAPHTAHDLIQERLNEIGSIVLKSIDRADRSTALEGIWALKRILDHYGERKALMPGGWFQVGRKELTGLSDEALAIVNRDRTWFEHRVLTQIFLSYQIALAKTPDLISALSDATRIIAEHAAGRGDGTGLDLSVKIFNNYLREAIKHKALHAIYDILYQYRRLAETLCERPGLLRKIGSYFRYYASHALAHGLHFVPQIVAFDLVWLISRALEAHCPAATDLLGDLLSLGHQDPSDAGKLLLKAKLILGGYLVEHGKEPEAERVRENLNDVPAPVLNAAMQELVCQTEQTYWEVTDRQIGFEWVPPERRGPLKAFVESLGRGP